MKEARIRSAMQLDPCGRAVFLVRRSEGTQREVTDYFSMNVTCLAVPVSDASNDSCLSLGFV